MRCVVLNRVEGDSHRSTFDHVRHFKEVDIDFHVGCGVIHRLSR